MCISRYCFIGERQKRQRHHCCVAIIFFVFCLSLAATTQVKAQISDPFAATGNEWLPFDAYEIKASAPPPPPAIPDAEQPALSETAAAETPEKAAPERPLNYPSMPSGPLAHDVIVTSTTDERPTFMQEKKGWSDFSQADEEANRQAEAEKLLQSMNKDPFGVRFATLPSANVQSIFADRVSNPKLAREAKAAKAAKDALKLLTPEQQELAKIADKKRETKGKEQTAACEAYADYQHRQLDALASDRRTLAELKAALSDLGLVKQLGFMTGQDSSLGPTVDTTTADAGKLSQQPSTKTQ